MIQKNGALDTVAVELFASSNRVGKFQVLHEILMSGDEAPMLRALFGLCVVLEVGEHESGRGKLYIATSDLFQPLTEGEEIPTYRIEYAYDCAFDDPTHETVRVNNGPFGFVAVRQNIVRAPSIEFPLHLPLPSSTH